MKIPNSVRALYEELYPRYRSLEKSVESLIKSKKEKCWHYEGRLKTEESFALKLETGREKRPASPEDFFACTLVVENHTKLLEAERLITDQFKLHERRPRESNKTHLPPYSFDYDDLRLYVSWKDDPAQRPTDLNGLIFEAQIKTFLQHAWAIATHDLTYKTDAVNWATSRVAYQVKAMLENAELSISEAKRLTAAVVLSKEDQASNNLRLTIGEITKRWKCDQLPNDLRRMAQNVSEMSTLLQVSLSDLWAAVDRATDAGRGAQTLNLSPYAAILEALISERGAALFTPLDQLTGKGRIFIPLEITLPAITGATSARIIRPPVV